METKIIIIENYSISSISEYVLLSILFSLVIRIILSIFRSLENYSNFHEKENFNYCHYFTKCFLGVDKDPTKSDNLVPFFLGIIELLVFPFLMKSGLWVGIAFWIGLKTVAQWDNWKTNRRVFNRFLLGTSLIVILSFTIMSNFVDIKLKDNNSNTPVSIENGK